jgi:hypothetical protein
VAVVLGAARRGIARVVVTALLAAGGLTAVAAAVPGSAAASTASFEQQFVAKMNAARAAAGLPAYSVASDLTSIARSHSRSMASQQRLYHNPSLTSQVQDWQAVGENVGEGPTVDDIHSAFMHSTEHRANILDHDFTQVGVGVAVDSNGIIWVTEDFRQPMHSASAPVHHASAPTHHTTVSRPAGTSTLRSSHATASRPVVARPAAPRPASVPSPAVLRARLDQLRHAAAAAASADPVSQAFDFLSAVGSLSS